MKHSARRATHRFMLWGWALLISLAGGGCAFGPKALERSHGRYNEAVRLVEEEQLLRNIVHLRYNEIPLHLNVASIAAQYELNGMAEAQPFFEAPNPSGSTFRTFTSVLPGASVSGANRPTLTLVPSDNGDAVRQFLTPISAESMLFLTQTSWPVSTVLRLWVERMNGVPNAVTASGPQRDLVPDFARFRRAADLLQVMQDQGLGVVRSEDRLVEVGGPFPSEAVNGSAGVDAAKNGLEYRKNDDGTSWSLVRKERRLVMEVNPAIVGHPVHEELAAILHLQPGLLRYGLVATPGVLPDPARSPTVPPSTDLKVNLRSTAQVLYYLANGVETPCEHIDSGLVRPPVNVDGAPFDERIVTEGLFAVHAHKSHKPPEEAFVAVKYRDYWFYIDDRDQASKATFSLMLMLSRLDFARHQVAGGPLLTLPVGR